MWCFGCLFDHNLELDCAELAFLLFVFEYDCVWGCNVLVDLLTWGITGIYASTGMPMDLQ